MGYFVEVDLKYSDSKKEKTKNSTFCPEYKICNKNVFCDYLKKRKPDKYTRNKKLICDWTKKNVVLNSI